MMWEPHPSFDELEQLVLQSSALDHARQRRILDHCHACARCRERKIQIADFYESLGALRLDAISPHARRLLDALRSGGGDAAGDVRVTELMSRVRTSHIPGEKPGAVAFAARDANGATRYVSVGTLTSADESTVLHILRDNGSGRYLLQVHADLEADTAYALVTFDLLPGDYVTDVSGEAAVSVDAFPPMNRLRAFVRPALTLFFLLPHHLEKLEREGDISLANAAGELLLLSREGDRIRIEPFRDSPGDEIRLLACIAESDGWAVRYRGNAAFVPSKQFAGLRAIALY